jgi:hypothetical protein
LTRWLRIAHDRTRSLWRGLRRPRRGNLLGLLVAAFAVGLIAMSIVWMVRAGWPEETRKDGDPLTLLQLGVTLLVVFFVQQQFARQTTETRAEKDAVIGSVKDVIGSLDEARDQFYECYDAPNDEAKRLKLVRALKDLAAHLKTVECLIGTCGMKLKRVKMEHLAETLGHFRRFSTSTLPTLPPEGDVTGVESTYQEFHRSLSTTIIDVNRA